MRLISCHIENFGKLSNFDYEFNSEKNIICKDNAWGKTTFAAFIRIMFYGFDNQLKRDDFENERKRFKPWKGGVYGGSISFEVNGKTYIANRVFFDREKEDTFSLRDANSLVESNDFSKNLGEEIFKMNHESFKNTIFIGQDNLETKSTRDIEGLLADVNVDSYDVTNLDKAMDTLNGIINSLSPNKKSGRLNKIAREIDDLEYATLSIMGNKTRASKLLERSKKLELELKHRRQKKEFIQNKFYTELEDAKLLEKEEEEPKKKEEPQGNNKKKKFKFEPFGKSSLVGLFVFLFGFFFTVLGVVLQTNTNYSLYAYPLIIIGIIIMLYYAAANYIVTKHKNDKEEKEAKKKKEAEEKEKKAKALRVENARAEVFNPFDDQDLEEIEKSPNRRHAYLKLLRVTERDIDVLKNELIRLNREIEDLSKEVEIQEDKVLSINKLKEDSKELSQKYDYTVKAKEYLIKAKENFGKRYNEPVKENFDKFLGQILDEDNEFILNVNNELIIKDAGDLRDIRLLSKAFRDVIGLSMRLSFIESAFKEEKPFIILDDPFVNVDDNTLGPCLQLINNLSKDYQIVYFTCSISRS